MNGTIQDTDYVQQNGTPVVIPPVLTLTKEVKNVTLA